VYLPSLKTFTFWDKLLHTGFIVCIVVEWVTVCVYPCVFTFFSVRQIFLHLLSTACIQNHVGRGVTLFIVAVSFLCCISYIRVNMIHKLYSPSEEGWPCVWNCQKHGFQDTQHFYCKWNITYRIHFLRIWAHARCHPQVLQYKMYKDLLQDPGQYGSEWMHSLPCGALRYCNFYPPSPSTP
jgi:hypothetical protein